MGRIIIPLNSPVHEGICDKERRYNVEDLGRKTTCRVEDCSVQSAG